ncbi:collagenase [Chromobacterium sp. IIBBL 290-4]|uniref:collagenase n=1 Tax=Chromobacterium sp. IIBBL 290-4 TaxID=2953890 RepID=UPI0020B7652C|nr:collagenase [Chromobacterium sp. IIBBL 290-4]UTH73489.1 M9 family metallopeptidase N-terminal domain-containing protein [Chromobacterium sp. IIBBL 290-4]
MKTITLPRRYRAMGYSVMMSALLSACVASNGGSPGQASQPAPQANQPSAKFSSHSPALGDKPSYPHGLPPTAPDAGSAQPPARPQGPQGAMALKAARKAQLAAPSYADCDEARLGQLSGQELVRYVASVDGTCVNRLFQADALSYRAVSPANMKLVAAEARVRAANWDGQNANGLWPLAVFLKAGYFQQYSHAKEVGDYGPTVDQPVMQVVEAMAANPALWNVPAQEGNGDADSWYRARDARQSVAETMILADSVRKAEYGLPLLTRFFGRYNAAAKDNWARFALHPMQTLLFNMHYQPDFAQKVEQGQLDGLVASLAGLTRAGQPAFADEQMFLNTLRETGRFMQYPRTAPQAESAVAQHLQGEKFGAAWAEAVYALKKMGKTPCERYGICQAEQELRAHLFPNRWSFDNGNLVFETPLSLADVEPLYYAMKQVQTQLFRVAGTRNPVPDDTNAKLRMVIYGTKTDYQRFQGLLNDLSTDNGGIYIEKDGTFYTYQREVPKESYLTLEELVRHEYVHYLSGRFIQPGMWGTSEFYRDDRRMPWYDEGFAEFMAWSTPRDGIKVRGHVVDVVAGGWPGSFLEPSRIMRSSYSDGWDFYSHSALWFYYLNQKQPGKIADILASLRAVDVKRFDALVRDMGGDGALVSGFRDYVDQQVKLAQAGQLGNTSTVEGTDWMAQDKWQTGDAAAVETAMRRALPVGCQVWADGKESGLRRFECNGTLPLNAADNTQARQELDRVLDGALQSLVKTGGLSNMLATNCAATDYDFKRKTAALRCEGPLGPSGAKPQPPQPGELGLAKTSYGSAVRCLRGQLQGVGGVERYQLVRGPQLGRAQVADWGAFNYRRDADQPGKADSMTVRLSKGAQSLDVVVELNATPRNVPEDQCWAQAG